MEHGEERLAAIAEWAAADERVKNAWANEIDATEAGAYGLALAGVELVKGLVAVRRAQTRTGADYYLGAAGAIPEDLEGCYRLEISGIDRGTASAIKARLRQKVEQAEKGESNLPAIAAVVEFSTVHIVSADVEQK